MNFNQESATEKAKQDLAERLGVTADSISEKSVSDEEFPDLSLGAAVKDEMSAQMISSGWKIILTAAGKDHEYRADKYSLRLVGYEGENHLVHSEL